MGVRHPSRKNQSLAALVIVCCLRRSQSRLRRCPKRDRVLEKLAKLGVVEPFLKLLSSILQENGITVDDCVCKHEPFTQTAGYPRGDNLNSIACLLHDLPREIQDLHSTVVIQLYTDDIVLYIRIRRDRLAAVRSSDRYCQNNRLTINVKKTKAMRFRRGGAVAKHDKLRLRYASNFCYPGLEFSPRRSCSSRHIARRAAKSLTAMASIPSLQGLSVRTALRLTHIKVGAVASYGVSLI